MWKHRQRPQTQRLLRVESPRVPAERLFGAPCRLFILLRTQRLLGQLHLLQSVQHLVERSGVLGIAVFDGLEHPSFGGAAVNFLAVGQQPIPTADDIAHLIQSVEGAGHAGKSYVPVIMEPAIYQQGLMGFQIVDAL